MGATIARILCLTCAAALAVSPAQGQLLRAPASETQIVERSTLVLRELGGLRVQQIPQSLLSSAEAVAIVPGMMRGAFVVGLQHGRGVVLVKDELGQWTAPQFLTITGGSVGWQAGLQATDLVLVFASRGSVRNLLQGQITVGVDASAAAGPLGRRASAATDLPLQAEIYSYSRSRGLFAGVSIDGSSLQLDPDATGRYYATAPAQTLPPSATELVAHLIPFSDSRVPVAPGLAPAVPGPLPDAGSRLESPGSTLLRPAAPAGANRLPEGPAMPGVMADGASLAQGRSSAGRPPNPADPATTADPAENLRRQLLTALAELEPLLDAHWKAYLQVPAPVIQPPAAGTQANAQDMRETLQRYDAVATAPQYAGLAQRAEFQRVRQLLHQLAAIPPRPAPLNLPPPPR